MNRHDPYHYALAHVSVLSLVPHCPLRAALMEKLTNKRSAPTSLALVAGKSQGSAPTNLLSGSLHPDFPGGVLSPLM